MKSSQATGKLESADATCSSDDSRSWTYWRGDAAEGFEKPGPLKDYYYVIHAMAQQLPKQDHYDYRPRNLKTVLNYAGAFKRNHPMMSILIQAL